MGTSYNIRTIARIVGYCNAGLKGGLSQFLYDF